MASTQKLSKAQRDARRRRAKVRGKDFKMSEVILDVAAPLVERSAGDREQTERVLMYAMAVWNIRYLPTAAREEMVQATLQALSLVRDAQGLATAEADIALLEKRQRELYPDLRRLIVSHEFVHVGNRFRFNVMSTELPSIGVAP
jgi:hypothetical protein